MTDNDPDPDITVRFVRSVATQWPQSANARLYELSEPVDVGSTQVTWVVISAAHSKEPMIWDEVCIFPAGADGEPLSGGLTVLGRLLRTLDHAVAIEEMGWRMIDAPSDAVKASIEGSAGGLIA